MYKKHRVNIIHRSSIHWGPWSTALTDKWGTNKCRALLKSKHQRGLQCLSNLFSAQGLGRKLINSSKNNGGAALLSRLGGPWGLGWGRAVQEVLS